MQIIFLNNCVTKTREKLRVLGARWFKRELKKTGKRKNYPDTEGRIRLKNAR
jgi:hypothetical protein